jgi:uncharacterized protein (DUF1810 family)
MHMHAAGQKRSHWIWYVWPSLRGVRTTKRPDLLLPSLAAAREYLRNATLCTRLVAITQAATQHLNAGVAPARLFGSMAHLDKFKFWETCTLFAIASAQLEQSADLASDEKQEFANVTAVFDAALRAIAPKLAPAASASSASSASASASIGSAQASTSDLYEPRTVSALASQAARQKFAVVSA